MGAGRDCRSAWKHRTRPGPTRTQQPGTHRPFLHWRHVCPLGKDSLKDPDPDTTKERRGHQCPRRMPSFLRNAKPLPCLVPRPAGSQRGRRSASPSHTLATPVNKPLPHKETEGQSGRAVLTEPESHGNVQHGHIGEEQSNTEKRRQAAGLSGQAWEAGGGLLLLPTA